MWTESTLTIYKQSHHYLKSDTLETYSPINNACTNCSWRLVLHLPIIQNWSWSLAEQTPSFICILYETAASQHEAREQQYHEFMETAEVLPNSKLVDLLICVGTNKWLTAAILVIVLYFTISCRKWYFHNFHKSLESIQRCISLEYGSNVSAIFATKPKHSGIRHHCEIPNNEIKCSRILVMVLAALRGPFVFTLTTRCMATKLKLDVNNEHHWSVLRVPLQCVTMADDGFAFVGIADVDVDAEHRARQNTQNEINRA